MAITGNKGEWSEIYTLFKLLGDGVVYAGDGNMEKIDNLFYPIMRIIRHEERTYEYAPKVNEGRMVVVYEGQTELMRVSMAKFAESAVRLLHLIQDARGAAFSLPSVEQFMASVKCHTLKARSVDKTDIRIVIHDLRTGTKPTLGFSIKSQLGQPSTLLNPGMTTNFVYKVSGKKLSNEDIAKLNKITGQIERMDSLFRMGAEIKYSSMDCPTFEDNLMIIDSLMPEIVAECIKEHYISSPPLNDLNAITEAVAERNPLGVRNQDNFYKAKMKSLLIDSALGMTPAKVWTRQYDANGGYLVVRDDGEVLCYHFYDRNQLEDYLFNNTRLDYPSRSRYDYGYLFKKNGEVFVKLNLQIRFK